MRWWKLITAPDKQNHTHLEKGMHKHLWRDTFHIQQHTAEKHRDTHPHYESNLRFLCCCHIALQSSLRGDIIVSPKMSVNKTEGARQSSGFGASSLSWTVVLLMHTEIFLCYVWLRNIITFIVNFNHSSYCRLRIEEAWTRAWQLHSGKVGLACRLWTKFIGEWRK